VREEINAIVRTTIYGMIAAAAGTVAFLFAVVAAFLWFQQHYDSIIACLVVGGMFLCVAVIALVSLAIARRRAARRKAREEEQAAKATPSWLADPAMVLTAIQIARTIGLGKIIPLAVAGLAAFGTASAFGGRDKSRAAAKRAARQKSTQEEQTRRVA
jgi:hypothetical protein